MVYFRYSKERREKMIKVIITKTSSDYWYDLKVLPNLEALIEMCRQEGALILQENFWHEEDPSIIQECWFNVSLEDAKEISKCEFNLEIYDDYRE